MLGLSPVMTERFYKHLFKEADCNKQSETIMKNLQTTNRILPKDQEVKTAYGYARVASTIVTNRGSSIAGQEEAISDYCRKNKIKLLNTFSDFAKSGIKLNRPALMSLLKSIRKTSVNYLIVTELSRLTKNTKDYLFLKLQLKTVGVEILTVNSPRYDVDHYSKFFDEIISAVNALYPRLKAKKKTYIDCSCELT